MSVMVLQGLKYSPQKSRPLESGHRRHGVCIAIECSYKLDQKNEFKFLCELCTFSQIRSHILTTKYIVTAHEATLLIGCVSRVYIKNNFSGA